MHKIVTVDLDGTLLNNSNEIIGGDETIELINQIQDLGAKFIINTGRLDHDIVHVTEQYDLPTDLRVSQNGAVIIEDNKVASTILDKDEALKFWEYAKNLNFRIEVNTISNRYWLSERPKDFVKELYPSEVIVNEFEPIIKYQPVTLFLIMGDKDQVFNLREYIIDNFEHIYPVQTSDSSLEILSKNVSKGEAIRRLFPAEDIFAVGDSENDHSIFEVADKSYYVDHQSYIGAESVGNITRALEKIYSILKK